MKQNINICVILGGGGHAHVLVDIIKSNGRPHLYAVLDPDRSLKGHNIFGVPILGDDKLLPDLVNDGVNSFIVGIGSTRDNSTRRRLFELGVSHNLEPITIAHTTSVSSRWSKIGKGSQLLPNCTINTHATLGTNTIINSNAVVEHDCVIGDHVNISTGANLCGDVQIGSGAFVGSGATIMQGITIGTWAVVGAGSLVLNDVPPYSLVAGVPAKFLEYFNKPNEPAFNIKPIC